MVLGGGVVLTMLAYRPALDVGFVFDDRINIEQASGVHWTEVSRAAVRALRDSTLIPRRAVANASFALNHLAGGLEPRGYHLVNILTHLAVGLALVWVALLYLRAVFPDRERERLLLAAVLSAVLFLVHPLNSQAVTYVVQRMASLAALFSLLALGAYWVGRTRPGGRGIPWFGAAAVAWLLALGSKENAILLPLVVLTYEWCFKRAEWRDRWRGMAPGHRWGAGIAGLVLLAVAAVAILGYAGGNPVQWAGTFQYRDYTPVERVLTQARVQVFYLTLLVWPAPGRLSLDHDFAVSRGLLAPPTTVLACLFWLVVLAAGLVLAVRRPRYGFPLLAYLEWHLVEAGPVNLELVFEHRMYLPMTMLALAAAVGLAEVSNRYRRVSVVAALLLALPLAWGTWQRNLVWADPEVFIWDTARKAPSKVRPWYNLGTLLLKWDRPEEAVEPLERAVQADSTDWRATDQLGLAYLGVGRTDDALATFRRAAALEPDEVEPELHIGRALELRGSTLEASRHLLDVGTRRGLAGDVMMAMLALQRAVELDSTSSAAHNALGNAYLLAGRPLDALPQYRQAVSLDSTNVEAVYNAGMTMADHGDPVEALVLLERFVELAPARFASQVAAVRNRVRDLRGEL
jgi:Flp pilus assembly protein TadD